MAGDAITFIGGNGPNQCPWAKSAFLIFDFSYYGTTCRLLNASTSLSYIPHQSTHDIFLWLCGIGRIPSFMASAPSGPQLSGDNNNSSSSSSSHHPTASTSFPSSSCSYSTLVQYLWQTPFFFNYRFDDHACKAILSFCYESLWQQNPALMEQYFYSSPQELQQAIEKQLKYRSSSSNREHDMNTTDTSSASASSINLPVWHSNAIVPPIDSSSERGRQCGHVFRKGEPVYRCRKVQAAYRIRDDLSLYLSYRTCGLENI